MENLKKGLNNIFRSPKGGAIMYHMFYPGGTFIPKPKDKGLTKEEKISMIKVIKSILSRMSGDVWKQ